MRKTIAFLVTFLMTAGGAIAQGQTEQLVEAYNASGRDIYARLAANPGNVVLSPLSIGTAMAMALAGARGATEAEMLRVLKQRLTRPEIDAANGALMQRLNGYQQGTPPAKLAIANALMLMRDEKLSADYTAVVKDKYTAEVFAHAGLDDVNKWVSEKTEGKIPKILDRLNPRAVAVLLDAVYFKAQWAAMFSTYATKNEPFSLTATRRVDVPMMHRTGNYTVVAREGFRAILLPYNVPSLGMVVVLPDAIDGLSKVEQKLGAAEFPALITALAAAQPKSVALALPRFKTKFGADLKAVFQQLGMQIAFSDRADFSGMTGRPPADSGLKIDEIAHRAVVDVTEEGTEAAAATAVVVAPTMARPQPAAPEPFRVDRPFLFFIVDQTTAAVLFQGRIADPR